MSGLDRGAARNVSASVSAHAVAYDRDRVRGIDDDAVLIARLFGAHAREMVFYPLEGRLQVHVVKCNATKSDTHLVKVTAANTIRVPETKSQERDASGGGHGAGSGEFEQKRQAAENANKDDAESGDQSNSLPVTEEDVRQAIGQFQTQLERDHLSAVHAEAEGTGPGLRVLLKDSEGKLLKAMTGTEFVKMREHDVVEPPKKGKILDRKY